MYANMASLVQYSVVLSALSFELLAAFRDSIIIGPRDFCEFETFEAECKDGEVIHMSHAKYGRMEMGRCVESNLGFVGCSADVLNQADRRCSGRQRCSIKIPDEIFSRERPCLKELKSYFQASYKCVKVESVDTQMCTTCDYVKLTRPYGVIPSLITERGRCGSPDCPWDIEVSHGQRINLTLTDYALSSTDIGGDHYSDISGCRVYATIKEPGTLRHFTICGGQERVKHQYISASNHIQIRIVGQQESEHPTRFLIQYQAIGCPNPKVPRGGWLNRVGNTSIISCNFTRDSWKIKCQNGQWIGRVGNCSIPAPTGEIQIGALSIPNGLSIAIILAVAVCIGACILLAGLIFIKRHRPRAVPQYHPASQYNNKQRDFNNQHPVPAHGFPHNKALPTNQNTLQKNDYTHIWQRPLPEQPISAYVSDSWISHPDNQSDGNSINPYGAFEGELENRTLNLVKATVAPMSPHPIDPSDNRYFQLEPDELITN